MERITATMIKAKVSAQKLVDLDKWIAEDLQPAFLKSWGKQVSVATSQIKWNSEQFVKEMRERGFGIEYKCDDRPCGSSWYEISL